MKSHATARVSESHLSKGRLGWAGLAAFIVCAACCAIPLLAVVGVGSGTAAMVTAFLKPGSELLVGGVVFAVALAVMTIRSRIKPRTGCGPSCKVDGTCCERGSVPSGA